MEIQQHDGVVVDVAGSRQGFAKLLREGEVLQGRGRRQGMWCCCPPSPPLFIGPLEGGGASPGTHLHGGAAAKGEGGWLPPPSQVGRPPPPGFPTLGAGGGPRGAPQPTKGWFPSPFSPWGPPG